MFDYLAVSGTLEGRMIEYADHLHEHMVQRLVVREAATGCRGTGYRVEMKSESIERYRFPDWTRLESAHHEAVGPLRMQPGDQAAVAHHRGVVLVPVRMLFSLHLTEQLDELLAGRVSGLGAHSRQLDRAFDHDIRGEVGAAHIQRCPRIASQVRWSWPGRR